MLFTLAVNGPRITPRPKNIKPPVRTAPCGNAALTRERGFAGNASSSICIDSDRRRSGIFSAKSNGASISDHLERYAKIDPAFVRALGGDRYAPALWGVNE
jgi:hypothetical protein